MDNLTSFKKKEDKLRILYYKREQLPDHVFEKKERPKWATKEWVESRRTLSSEKSENEEPTAQNLGAMHNNMPIFPNMPHQVGMQQNNFPPFYHFPTFHTGQFMPNNTNVQNPGFMPMNFIYPYQFQQQQQQQQGKNNFIPPTGGANINNPNARKPPGETLSNEQGIAENPNVDNISNSNSQSTKNSDESS